MADRAPFGVYVHWPFCQAKCPYCDFNSHVMATVDHDRWSAAFRQDITAAAERLGPRQVSTIFFGGGTPSLMPPDVVADILADIRAVWPVANNLEVTLEANPTSVEAGRFRGYRDAGVSRISVGVQSLRDGDLKALGRLHSASEARAAVELALSLFNRVSLDLIYARQGQSLAEWRSELKEALALGTTHLSLYQLTIEDGTAFGDRYRAGRLKGLPDEDLSADLFDITQDLTSAAGRPAYEISNHAKADQACAHNLIYWRGQEYLGLGPGAHGRENRDGQWVATEAARMPGAWLAAVEGSGHGVAVEDTLPVAERAVEQVMMGLRLVEGLPLDRLPEGTLNANDISKLQESGHLWHQDGRIGTTAAGRPVLNAVLRALLT